MKSPLPTAFSVVAIAVITFGISACVEFDSTMPPPPGRPRPGPPMPGPPVPPVPDVAFSRTGTVTRHSAFDNCMEGSVNYDLHGGGPRSYRLSAHGRPQHIALLERAVSSGAPVHITGIRRRGTRPDCDYVLVTRVTPVGW